MSLFEPNSSPDSGLIPPIFSKEYRGFKSSSLRHRVPDYSAAKVEKSPRVRFSCELSRPRFRDSVFLQRRSARLHSRFHREVKTEPPLHLIIEVKGYDERVDIKAQAAQKRVDAVSADAAYGRWAYSLARKTSEVKQLLAMA